jgi:hypothetical protein
MDYKALDFVVTVMVWTAKGLEICFLTDIVV